MLKCSVLIGVFSTFIVLIYYDYVPFLDYMSLMKFLYLINDTNTLSAGGG